jgi:hypothetical protein
VTPTPRGNITGKDPEWKRFDGCALVGVVGYDFHQPALFAASGAPRRGEFRYECLATLVPEPDNPHDDRAVKVMVGEHHVGYLARGGARRHHPKLATMRDEGQPTDYFAFIRREDRGGPLQMSLRIPRDGKLFQPFKPRTR